MRLRSLIFIVQMLAVAIFPLVDARASVRPFSKNQFAHGATVTTAGQSQHLDSHRVNSFQGASHELQYAAESHSSPLDRDCLPDCCGMMCHSMAMIHKPVLAMPRASRPARIPLRAEQVSEGLKDRLERPPKVA